MSGEKTVFFDVDGTIVTYDHRIPETTVEALYAARARGHRLIVNTGRPYLHIEPQVKALPFDGYICALGGHIVFEGRDLVYTTFSAEESRRIRDFGRECGMLLLFESEKGVFCDPAYCHPRGIEEFRWLESIGVPAVPDVFFDSFAIDKFVCWPSPDARVDEFCSGLSDRLDFIFREHSLIEAVSKGCSKSDGMIFMLEWLGLELADSFAIGDGANDLPMLHTAHTGILMGNAPQHLWPEADYITASICDDGLARALEHFGLI